MNKAEWLATHRNFDGEDEDDIGPVYADGSLLSELRSFYYEKVAIGTKKRKAASDVVEEIIEQFQIYTRNANKHEFGSILRQGSSYEGLKVVKPDEFDLLVPLKIDDLTIEEAKAAPGYYFISYDRVDSGNIWQKCIVDGFLNPVLVSHEMQSVIQLAINFMRRQLPDYDIKMRESGPAKTLNVQYKNGTINIDLVPSVEFIGDEYLVAKRHRKADNYYQSKDTLGRNKFNHIWRISFSAKEKSVIQSIDKTDECHRACLKILKTVAVSETCKSHFKMLSSYHLKTCLLHLSRKNVGSWHQDNLDDRFKNLINILIEKLKTKQLPSLFDESIDLFEKFSAPALENFENWLQGKTENDDIIMKKFLGKGSLSAEQYHSEAQCDVKVEVRGPSQMPQEQQKFLMDVIHKAYTMEIDDQPHATSESYRQLMAENPGESLNFRRANYIGQKMDDKYGEFWTCAIGDFSCRYPYNEYLAEIFTVDNCEKILVFKKPTGSHLINLAKFEPKVIMSSSDVEIDTKVCRLVSHALQNCASSDQLCKSLRLRLMQSFLGKWHVIFACNFQKDDYFEELLSMSLMLQVADEKLFIFRV